MKTASLLKSSLLAALLTASTASGIASAADRVGDFSLLDQEGYFHHMAWYNDHAAIALLVQANDSTATADAVPAFQALKQQFDAQGIEFMMINPMGRENRDAVAATLSDWGVADIPVLMDDAQMISRDLGIERVGEVLLFDPSSFTVLYRGTVAGAEQAISETLADKAVSAPLLAGNGEAVAYPEVDQLAARQVSYVDEVAPIIAENCASCHRAGGIAPFAMDSHAMVQGWSPMIREVVMTKRMPPGQIDGHVGEFINDMRLEDSEVQTLLAWIESGSPKDGSSDPLTELTWPTSKWAFGEPDYIIKVPPQEIPATGVLDYIHVSVPIDIEKDRWLRGSQYVAGDRTVLHHTLNGLTEPGASRRGGFLGGGNPDQANITAYIPGAEPRLNPPNTGGLLKAGSVLNLQLHYTTTGKETTDASEIGLWFYPEGEVPEKRMAGQCACIFTPTWTNIPPGDPNFEQQASVTLSRDAYMRSFTPHMHFRGKYMRWVANYPDGSSEELINVANYNYNWQLAYTYEEPKFMPAGTTITAIGAFDNSAQNPYNPDPERSVPWGQQSWDEMFFGAMSWQYADSGGGED